MPAPFQEGCSSGNWGAATRLRGTSAGGIYYVIHDEICSSPQEAWQKIAWQIPFCETIAEKEQAKGRTLQDAFNTPSFRDKLSLIADREPTRTCLEKKAHGKSSVSTSSSATTRGAAGGNPAPDWEPKEDRSSEKKEVRYPNNPDVASGSFKRNFKGTKARESKVDGSVWESDITQHGGEQWKMWKTKRSWQNNEQPASIWPDGRVRKWGDQ